MLDNIIVYLFLAIILGLAAGWAFRAWQRIPPRPRVKRARASRSER